MYYKTIYNDSLVDIQADESNSNYHEFKITSEWKGKIDSIILDRTQGCITIKLIKNEEEPLFDKNGDYIKTDKDSKFTVIEC